VSSPRALHNIALTGFMGTGKSSAGRMAAQTLGFDFIDTDERIEARAGKTIVELFAQDGERAFREWECQVVAELASCRQTVIATGGGLGANLDLLNQLKEHAFTICLWASPDMILRRVQHQPTRPLLYDPDPLQRIQDLMAAREAAYKQADLLLDSGMRPVREVAQQIVHHYQQARSRA
jgi:shikimate kinase